MALAKDRTLGDLSSPGFDDYHHKVVLDEGDGSEKTGGVVKNLALSKSSSPSSGNSNGFAFRPENCQPEEARSLINFKSGYDSFMHANASVLSFEQREKVSQNTSLKASGHRDDYSMWESNLNHGNQWNQMNTKYNSDPLLVEHFNRFDTASNCGDWIYTEATAVTDSELESGSQDAAGSCLKRSHTGESPQALKKQCTSATKKPNKPKSVPSKDPQSIAAKNRRERISERLKILQELVPNGSKVDLVTMLEKAISYVKFLQLQVKVLATDEFWPVQGGKAPDITQVKEAIDAILSSHRDRNSSSKQS